MAFVLASAAAVVAPGQTPAPAAPPPKLGSTVFKWENCKPQPTGVGVRRDVATYHVVRIVTEAMPKAPAT